MITAESLQDRSKRNIYIIKPGEETNRGRGIQLESDLEQIQQLLSRTQQHKNGANLTHLMYDYNKANTT